MYDGCTMVPKERVQKLYEQRHCERIARKMDARTIFTGDSICNCLARYPSSWNTLEKKFEAANYGIGGDAVENVLFRAKHGSYPPNISNIVAILGTNNLKTDQTAKEIAKGVIEVGNIFRSRYKSAQIFIVGILPRDQERDRFYVHTKRAKVNRFLLSMCNDLCYHFVDTSVFEGRNSRIEERLYDEKRLHLNEPGNILLSNIIIKSIVNTKHPDTQTPRYSPTDDVTDGIGLPECIG